MTHAKTQTQSYYLQTLQERAYSDDKELKRRDRELKKKERKMGIKENKRKENLRKKERTKKSINNFKINETEMKKIIKK